MYKLNLADKEALRDIYSLEETSIEDLMKLFKLNRETVNSILYGSNQDVKENKETPH